MPDVIVSDTSCLILFYKIGELELLKNVFGNILVTETVSKEFKKELPEWVEIVSLQSNLHKGLSTVLDPGEATSIALAAEHDNSLLIIDEVKGRKVAREMGVQITGTLGVLIAAKEKGYIKAVKPIIKKMEKTNFRVSEALLQKVLERVHEA
jgi:predicted nucleic acid-binding protein